MTDKSKNLFESAEKIKEYRWAIFLTFFLANVCKGAIANVIGSFSYNLIIILIAIIAGVYMECELVSYIKNSEKYDIKNVKKELIYGSIMIFITVMYLGFLLTI